MAEVIYKKGQSANLENVAIVDGQILVTEDTGEMYVDISDGTRKKISDNDKQDKLISGKNIKTINDQPILGEGNILIQGPDQTYDPDSENAQSGIAVAQAVADIVNLAVGKKTTDGGEIFNLYEDTPVSGYGTVPKNKASNYSHAEGVSTQALGQGSHAEGAGTIVIGAGSHAEGRGVNFTVKASEDAIGDILIVKSSNLIDGLSELESIKKNAIIWHETDNSSHDGHFYFVKETELIKDSYAGLITVGIKLTLDREIEDSITNDTVLTVIMGGALSYISHTEGNYNNTVNIESTNFYDNEGSKKQRQHAEGSRTLALGFAAHSEGELTLAKGNISHAEGKETVAIGASSHAEGEGAWATGYLSHAEGGWTEANGDYSHAEGYVTIADGKYSHAGGYYTEAFAKSSTVVGQYNTLPRYVRAVAFNLPTLENVRLQIRIGNYTGSDIKTTKFWGVELLTNRESSPGLVNCISPMTEKYLDNPSDDTDDYSGTWHPRGETRYTVLNNNNVVFEVDKSWSNVRYYADTSLRKGLYTLYIYGDSYIDDLALLTVELEYKPLNPEGSYVSVAKVSDTTTRDNNDQLYSSLFAVGNGTSETDRKNAFEVYDDGHAEVQTQGATENSVVTNAKFKFYESEDDIPNDLPVGTIVFIME